MATTNFYHCTVCDEEFNTKLERKDHYRRFCQSSMDLIDLNGNIKTIERINGKFECLKCGTRYNRSDNLTTHWKKCQLRKESQMQWDYDNPLIEHLHYDGTYQIAVCDKCKHALPKEWIKGHFKDVHQVLFDEEQTTWLDEWLIENEVKTVDECKEWKATTDLLQTPVLGIEIVNASGCSACNFVSIRSRTVLNHLKTAHTLAEDAKLLDCHAQLVFMSNLRSYWKVADNSQPEETNDEGLLALQKFSLELKKLAEEDRPRSTVPDDERVRSVWMTRCDWDVLLEGMEWKAVKDLAKVPTAREPLHKVIEAFKLYLSQVCSHLKTGGLTIRRQILEGVNDGDRQKIFHAPQEANTINEYAEMGGRFLCFCLRSMEDEGLHWTVRYPFTRDQKRWLERINSLVGDDEDSILSDEWASIVHQALKSCVNCEEVTQSIDDVSWPLYRFLICSAINSSGDGFKAPEDIPHITKKLVFCMRANIFEQARRMDQQDDEWNDYIPGETMNLDLDGGLFGLKKFIIDKGQTPFNSIRYVANLATLVASDEPKIGFVEWVVDPEKPDNYTILSIRNKSFRFNRLLGFVDAILTETDRSLFLDILGGIKLPDTDLLTYEPTESLNNRHYHMSAFTEPINEYVQYKSYVINAWLKNSRQRSTVLRSVTDDTITWKRAAIMKWLDKCMNYLQLLFVLLQVTWGGPARLAEIPSLRFTNGQHERRNIYFDGGWIMILFRYSKTRSMTGRDRLIPRYPPPIVQKQLVYYLTFVRPAVSYFLKHYDLPGKKEVDEFLFVDHKRGHWSVKQVYRIFEKVTMDHGIGMITASVYRQAAALIMENLVKYKWEIPDEDSYLDEQFGHTSHQAEVSYAIEREGADLIRRDDRAHFKKGSYKWACVMIPNASKRGRLSKRKLDDHDEPTEGPSDLYEEQSTLRPRLAENILTVLPAAPINISQQLARSYLPTIKPIVNPDVEIQPRTLVALQMLLQNPAARFKSKYQAMAVQLFLERKTDLLVILPTGGGKSLTFELSPILEPEGTTILILPFVALLSEMRQRLKAVMPRFKAEQWQSERERDRPLPHILLLSIEEAISPEFQSFIQIANWNQTIKRFVLDEMHVLVTQSDFRNMFPRLVNTIRCIPVPFVGLSATIPEEYIDLIRLSLASVTCTVIRSPTDRANLQYFKYGLDSEYKTIEKLDRQLCVQIRNCWVRCKDKDKTRYIVFCHSARAGERFTAMIREKEHELGIKGVLYHSQMNRDDKERAYAMWRTGQCKLLIGTGAIGAGMDYANVRIVWHRGFASSKINYIQEVGRAGRDGQPAKCILIYCAAVEEQCKGFISAEFVEEYKSYVKETGCLRGHLTKFVDGERSDCFSSPNAQLCGYCGTAMARANIVGIESGDGGEAGSYAREYNEMAFEDLMKDRSVLVDEIKHLMDVLERKCGVCWFGGQTEKIKMQEVSDHGIRECRFMQNKCWRCLDDGHMTSRCGFHQSLRFESGCCYKCGFPQMLWGMEIHGDGGRGICDREKLKDKLGMVGWLCWRDLYWRSRIVERFVELRSKNDEGFMKWMGLFGMHKITNAVWLGLYFLKMSEEELNKDR